MKKIILLLIMAVMATNVMDAKTPKDAEENLAQALALLNKGDTKNGVKLLKQVAHDGYAPALNHLAYLYLNGTDGVEKNESLAAQCYGLSADQEDDDGLCGLAYCYLNGLGVRKNAEKAVELFTQAAKQNNGDAYMRLAMCYTDGV
ncbi:MAG: sel1 repeat family protein, partial [Muribaculaceae bacterium]|nr:sel1 repeat family protein [Muribaculaceae bacterium]